MGDLLPAALLAGVLIIALVGVLVATTLLLRQVGPDRALVISFGGQEPRVVYQRALVVPGVHHAEEISLAVHPIAIERTGARGISCRDGIRANLRLTFFFRVNRTQEDILKVAQSVGCARAGDREVIRQLFEARVSEAVELVVRRHDFDELTRQREDFRDRVIGVVGQDLDGFLLETMAIDQLEQTPISAMDPNNLLDAQGIRKITDVTAQEALRTNEIRRREQVEIAKQNLEADRAIKRMELEVAEAETRQAEEIRQIKARFAGG